AAVVLVGDATHDVGADDEDALRPHRAQPGAGDEPVDEARARGVHVHRTAAAVERVLHVGGGRGHRLVGGGGGEHDHVDGGGVDAGAVDGLLAGFDGERAGRAAEATLA